MVLCHWRSEECRICDVVMGVTRANACSVTYGKGDLPCPLAKEWRAKHAHAAARHVPGTGFWNGASALKQHFVLSKNGSKYYLKYTFLAFPVLGIFGLGTSLATARCIARML